MRGPLLTLAVAVLLDVLRRQQVGLIAPFPVLMLAIVYSAYVGGLRPALVSVAITVLYALHYLARPGLPLRYDFERGVSLAAVAVSSLLAAIVVARLHARSHGADRARRIQGESEALERRFAILEQASLILGSARGFDVIFRDLARLLVPTLADWCTLHVVDESGATRLVAAAHRDPARDLVVRALADYGDRLLPFANEAEAPAIVSAQDAVLRASAADAEQLKLYRTLAPTQVVRLPLQVRERPAGFVTLVMASDSGRRFSPSDVELAEELARNSATLVDNARLRHEVEGAERRSRLVFEAHPQPMWVFDADTLVFLAVNAAAVHHYGWTAEEFLGMTILELLAPDDVAPRSPASERAGSRGEVAVAQHRRRDGTLVEMELVSHELELGSRRARLVLAFDTTERTRALAALHQSEEQLRHAQRGEAVGRVAGGVAHDFNNLLTTIRGFGELLLVGMVPDDHRRRDVQRICQAADRGALLTRQLLSFGRQQAPEPRLVSLNDVVQGTAPLVRRLVGADVQVELRLASGLGQVRIDPAQLEHVVVNLALNARDAMPSGGRLVIETAERRISSVSRGRPVRAGRYVVLSVGDSGAGFEEGEGANARDRTAATRTGLGRAIVFGIVRQYGGVVRVSTDAGEGTTVKVYLPRMEEEMAAESGGASPPDTAASTMRGSETVLVAEDEDGVRDLLRKVLTGLGYRVLTARHGRDALLLAGEYAENIDLLLTDVVMPEMSGHELADTLRGQRPELKVIFVSGYTDNEVLQRGISGRDAEILRKPFVPDELARRVRSLLDGAAG